MLLIHLLALPRVFQASPLRADSDTAQMLDAIRSVGGLWGVGRWFRGDWLLENGFYRPISSASLSLDYALYGEQAWGYCLTNWLLLGAIALGTALMVPRLLGVSPSWGWGVAIALSTQYTGLARALGSHSSWWGVLAVLGGVWAGVACRGIRGYVQQLLRWELLLAVGALFWGWDRMLSADYVRLIEWVPSRTALLGTAFAVWAVVCWLVAIERRQWGWVGIGGVLYLLALGAYEQPIMLAPFLLTVMWGRRRESARQSLQVAGAIIACVVLIALLRVSLVTTEPTRYQRQQLRSTLSGPVLTYLSDLVPPVSQWLYWEAVGWEPMVWFFKQPWDHLVGLVLYVGVGAAFFRDWKRLRYGIGWHALTLLPMAFLHFFEHYMVLPQIGKTLTDCLLIGWGADRVRALAGEVSVPAKPTS